MFYSESGGDPTTAKLVKIGDVTQYGIYSALAALALFLIAGVVLLKKRKNQ